MSINFVLCIGSVHLLQYKSLQPSKFFTPAADKCPQRKMHIVNIFLIVYAIPRTIYLAIYKSAHTIYML